MTRDANREAIWLIVCGLALAWLALPDWVPAVIWLWLWATTALAALVLLAIGVLSVRNLQRRP